jgi:hypothetical protein
MERLPQYNSVRLPLRLTMRSNQYASLRGHSRFTIRDQRHSPQRYKKAPNISARGWVTKPIRKPATGDVRRKDTNRLI